LKEKLQATEKTVQREI